MAISTTIRTFFINLTGYFVYKKTDLPIGVDFKADLENKFNIHPLCIFDVGANYGQTALYYHETFKNAKIYSFEPVKVSYLKLEKETQHIKQIECFQIALGEENKEFEIALHDESNSQLNSLKAIAANQGNQSVKEIIKSVTLDVFVTEKNIEQIDLLKIDTEGFELEVLIGSENFLRTRKIKAILCEVALSKRNTRNTQLSEIINALDKYDYFFVGLFETNVNYYKDGLAYSNALFILKNI
jgi:FkbM family methyltransferase